MNFFKISWPLAKSTALMGTLLIFFACGRASSPRTSIAQSRSSYDAPRIDTPSPSDPAQQSFVVPPELAIISARLSTTQESFADATQLLQEKTNLLLSDVNAGSTCSAKILDYRQPIPSQEKYFRWDAEQYTTQMDLEIRVSFEGVTSISERIQRLDDCTQRIPQFTTSETKEEEAIALTVSPALLTIKDPAAPSRDSFAASVCPPTSCSQCSSASGPIPGCRYSMYQ